MNNTRITIGGIMAKCPGGKLKSGGKGKGLGRGGGKGPIGRPSKS